MGKAKKVQWRVGGAVLVATIAACAPAMSSAFDDISASEIQDLRRQGSGTGELSVQVKIEAEAERPGATAQDFETEVEVRVLRAGVPVRDAVVTLSAYEGPEWTLERDDDGEYEGEVRGYHRAYRVDVVAGGDRVEGVYLAGPALHQITSPQPGLRVGGEQAVELTWQAEGDADETWVDGEAFDDVQVSGAMRYVVEPAQLERELHEVEDNEFEVVRLNRMAIEGGAPGSEITIAVKQEVEVLVEPASP
ncbi:hypothetical protein DL240_07460 [Lujinxingia litoralis]|uniref:Uncharacterized protein n=1 Tax=Lujinxingia litoralis TaxID=2211119 RepID=A0A328CAK5_9DELT|nr:hypothetical protein [Lujinxingia litoralis]RAL23978.1 hypothetical protein DL240_07460 [Lujinxingia litoralis]